MSPFSSWKQQQRYREVLTVCLPLVIGMSATTVMEFTDRVFLANSSMEAIAAATPAGITAFLFIAFFGGIAGYVNVFIAQYHGAGQGERIAAILWQALYFCLLAGLLAVILAWLCTDPLFDLVGHAPAVRTEEKTYFRILLGGAFFAIATQTLFGFFSGRGQTRPVMLISIGTTLINIPLDYLLIFGAGPIPALGIAGAGYATVGSAACAFVVLLGLSFNRHNRRQYGLLTHLRFRNDLFARLLRYGLPGTMQFTLDIAAFTLFIFLVGRIGTVELAATNIVLSINAIAFMPSIGMSQGISVLVGQALGNGQPHLATRATWSAIHLLLGYIFCIGLLFCFAPHWPVGLFMPTGTDLATYQPILLLTTDLLRIVTIYLLFDALYMVFSGVLRGAGDTRFIMWSVLCCSCFCFLLPLGIGTEVLDLGIRYAWACVVAFVLSLCTVAWYRFRQGKWQTMLVIESTPRKGTRSAATQGDGD